MVEWSGVKRRGVVEWSGAESTLVHLHHLPYHTEHFLLLSLVNPLQSCVYKDLLVGLCPFSQFPLDSDTACFLAI